MAGGGCGFRMVLLLVLLLVVGWSLGDWSVVSLVSVASGVDGNVFAAASDAKDAVAAAAVVSRPAAVGRSPSFLV